VASVGSPALAADFIPVLHKVMSMPTKTSQEIGERLEELLAKASMRDRAVLEKRLAILDTDADSARATFWRQWFVKLSSLVSLPAHPLGSNALQFFIPDGKYRMQVFALDDVGNGSLVLYLPDVLAKAVRNKLLVKNADAYSPAQAPNQILTIERMDASTQNPPEFMKHMMGWNRKAVKLTLHMSSRENQQFRAAEELCELAATEWSLPDPS
jgi:hypothetical protein